MAPDSPLAVALHEAQEKAEAQQRSSMVDETLRLVDPNWKG